MFMLPALRFVALISLSLAPALAFSQETLVISTATSVREGLLNKFIGDFEKESGVKVTFFKSAVRQPYAYFQEVLEGKSQAAIASIAYDDWVEELKKANVTPPKAGEVTHRVVARDLQWVITNQANGVKKLSRSQVRDVFSGKVKNWKEVGGADLPIQIYLAGDKLSGRAAFRKMATENLEFAPGAQEVPTREAMQEKVAKTPGALAYTALEAKAEGFVVVETEPIGRPITLVTKGRPSPGMEKFIAFVRKNAGSAGKD